MTELLAVALAFPVVVYTVLLGVSLVYWAFVLLGAFDLHLIGGDGAIEGGAKGVLEGASKGVLEGATKGVLEGGAKGVLEGAKGASEGLDLDLDVGDGEDGSVSILTALGFRRAPVTVVLTVLMAFSWLFSVLAMQMVGPIWPLPRVVLGLIVMVVSFVLALPVTSIAVRPIGKLFVTHEAKGNKDLIGRVCVVSTGTVDDSFGQATLEDGGAGLLVQIRCETPGGLKRGDRALVLGWDEKSAGFVVEPLETVLSELNEDGQTAGERRIDAEPGGGPDDREIPAEEAEGSPRRTVE